MQLLIERISPVTSSRFSFDVRCVDFLVSDRLLFSLLSSPFHDHSWRSLAHPRPASQLAGPPHFTTRSFWILPRQPHQCTLVTPSFSVPYFHPFFLRFVFLLFPLLFCLFIVTYSHHSSPRLSLVWSFCHSVLVCFRVGWLRVLSS